MALTGKTINELPQITTIAADASFVVELSGAQVLQNYNYDNTKYV